MSKHSQSPCFEDDENDHLFISLDENSPKRAKWGPAKLFMPEGCNIQPSTTTTAAPQSSATTAAQPSFTTTTTAAAQPSTAAPEPSAAAGSPLGRDGERGQRTYKTVGSWELGGGVKASVAQSSDGAFVNFRAKSVQLWTVFVCPQQHGTTFQRKCRLYIWRKNLQLRLEQSNHCSVGRRRNRKKVKRALSDEEDAVEYLLSKKLSKKKASSLAGSFDLNLCPYSTSSEELKIQPYSIFLGKGVGVEIKEFRKAYYIAISKTVDGDVRNRLNLPLDQIPISSKAVEALTE
ncbi:hypothetical protein AVEN_149339-1 [Araneus ventricosus]|uniref:Uncharacterized protein n=1 Tax=Araneus ventricosus TaxID=182803 RepID=A0A4Y2UWN6_ARAVE|nr:hypothetical protein AVEN_149339-1 [Araneus ventricosus]